jgi:4-alpha-glucanotransferase
MRQGDEIMKRLLLATLVVAVAPAFASQPAAAAGGASGRASGVLLHPTALPGKYGIGDLGPEAYHFVDFLNAAKQQYWQVLPLGPGLYGADTSFGGNPQLISPELMRKDGLLTDDDLKTVPDFPRDRVDFPAVGAYKDRLFRLAWGRFRQDASRRTALKEFAHKESAWLDDYALFKAAQEHFHYRPWNQWEQGLRTRNPEALKKWRGELADAIQYQKFLQFLFFKQWRELKGYANRNGVRIIGDVPFYVAHNSADVWCNQQLFKLDPSGNPRFVGGAPPDVFSKDGQNWGLPVYDWKAQERQHFAWWVERFQKALETVDILRLDHFRGFESYWEIPGGERTARNGRWVKSPGKQVFETLRARFPGMPFIVEDLPHPPEVEQLRDQFSLPGMRILQFGLFGGKDNDANPDNYTENSVVYLGTHDNNTIMGWFNSLDKAQQKELLARYKMDSPRGLNWRIIRTALESRSRLCIIPLQDILGLGQEARFNTPGTTEGNWIWRFRAGVLTDEVARRLAGLTEASGRSPAHPARRAS